MRLWHGRFRSIANVVQQLAPEGQLNVAAVDVPSLLPVHEEEMVSAGSAADVDVLSQLDVSVGAEDGQPTVAPRAKAVRREPVDANVARTAVAAQHHVAEVLQLGGLGMREISNLRGDNSGQGGAGEEEKLVGLMRADIREDAT